MSTHEACGAGGDLTPLFNWPAPNGQTWDNENRRHVYPTSKFGHGARTATQRLDDIEKRVTAVLNRIDYNTGNIHRMIAEDLASPAAAKELALLPELDYCFAQFEECISEDCKAMLRQKIKIYQTQHAHNLAREGTIDIVLKWKCSAQSPQTVRYVPENEWAWVNIAHRGAYKYLDWDTENARETEEDDSEDSEPRRPRRFTGIKETVPNPFATHNGGFYSCIIPELLPLLQQLSAAWTASVQIVVAPKLMTDEEKQEMAAYHAARRQAEQAIRLEQDLRDAQLRHWSEEDKHRPKSGPALPRCELLEQEIHWMEMCEDPK